MASILPVPSSLGLRCRDSCSCPLLRSTPCFLHMSAIGNFMTPPCLPGKPFHQSSQLNSQVEHTNTSLGRLGHPQDRLCVSSRISLSSTYFYISSPHFYCFLRFVYRSCHSSRPWDYYPGTRVDANGSQSARPKGSLHVLHVNAQNSIQSKPPKLSPIWVA